MSFDISYLKLEDIKEIIKVCPESVFYNGGVARCRNNLTPLWAAKNNNSYLKDRYVIIRLLLENGASMEDAENLN